MWLQRLLALLKEEWENNCPAFCDMEGYMLSAAAMESVLYPIPEEIQIHRDRNLADSIPRGMNVLENYRCNRHFCRGAENQALDTGVRENVINFVHRWSE